MHKIDKTFYGYMLTFADHISLEEMTEWRDNAKEVLVDQSGSFGILADMRTLKPLDGETKIVMQEGQKLFKDKGMERSAVILQNAIITLQFKDIAKKSGINEWERYIDASSNENWEKMAEDWIVKGDDPEQ